MTRLICAYYNAPGGCTRGARCTYKHDGIEGVGIAIRPQLDAHTASSGPVAVAVKLSTSVSEQKQHQQQHAARLNAQLLRQVPTQGTSINYDTSSPTSSSSIAPPHQNAFVIAAPSVAHDSIFSSSLLPASTAASSSPSFNSSSVPPIISSQDVSGRWTRGTPFAQKPAYVPQPSRPLIQLGALPTATSDPFANPAAATSTSSNDNSTATEEWNIVSTSRSRSSTASASASATPSQPRGVLALPFASITAASKSSSSSKTAARASNPTASKPQPRSSWSIADILDLSSLAKLDAITKTRPIALTVSDTNGKGEISKEKQDQAFPALPTKAAWGANSSASKSITTSSFVASTAVAASSSHPPSALKSSRPIPSVSSSSASHKPSKVTFATASSSSAPRSASLKPRRRVIAPPKPRKVHKPPKPTQLKRALIRERVTVWAHDILSDLITKAVGEIPAVVPSEPTRREKEQALAVLRRKIKHAAYETKHAQLEEQREKQRVEKEAKKEEARRKRDEEHAKAKEEKLKKKVEKRNGTMVYDENNSNFPTTIIASSDASISDEQQAMSITRNHALTSFMHDDDPNSSLLIALAIHHDSENTKTTEEEGADDADQKNEEKKGAESDDDSGSEESEVDEQEEKKQPSDDDSDDSIDENGSEFLPAPSLPSSHTLAYFPDPTPPDASSLIVVTSSSVSSSSESAAAPITNVRTLGNLSIPSSIQLTPQEQSLLAWHFQARHHGIQPKLQGACKRHCKQMWRPAIDDAVFKMMKELHRFEQRGRERDAVKAATKIRYVSGLKQTLKLLRVSRIRCVIVAANIEANEASGGLDDLLDDILGRCAEARVPIIFALTRRSLGHSIGLHNNASAVGILDYSAVGDTYKSLLQLTQQAQEEWSMFQEDTYLNPRPPNWEEELKKNEEILAQKKLLREKKQKQHASAVAIADAQRRAYEIAARVAAGGTGAKKKRSRSNDKRYLEPLPILIEEDAKTKRSRRKKARKSKKGGGSTKSTTTPAAAANGATLSTGTSVINTSSSGKNSKTAATGKIQTAMSTLKGAGVALQAITDALSAPIVDISSSSSSSSSASKSSSKHAKDVADVKTKGNRKKKEKKGSTKQAHALAAIVEDTKESVSTSVKGAKKEKGKGGKKSRK